MRFKDDDDKQSIAHFFTMPSASIDCDVFDATTELAGYNLGWCKAKGLACGLKLSWRILLITLITKSNNIFILFQPLNIHSFSPKKKKTLDKEVYIANMRSLIINL